MSKEQLPCKILNAGVVPSVLLIHGAFGDANDWDLVVPHLAKYQILLPDLPGHGSAKHLQPFSLDYAARLLARNIASQATDGVAHVVGFSLGASVALRLASSYPDLVLSLVVSGYGKIPRNWFTPYLPYAVWLDQRCEYAVPRPVTRWLMDGTDLRRPDLSCVNMPLTRQIFYKEMSRDEDDWPSPWPARTLIVAATKRGIIPSNDNVEVARRLAEIGRRANKETAAFAHSQMRHPWIRQDPRLFANLVEAWIEKSELLEGFVPIK